jgi:hypothetical protein
VGQRLWVKHEKNTLYIQESLPTGNQFLTQLLTNFFGRLAFENKGNVLLRNV